VLAGDEVALLNRAFFRVTAFPFQEQFHTLAPAKPTDGANITSQI
jgi:hypothetical protein